MQNPRKTNKQIAEIKAKIRYSPIHVGSRTYLAPSEIVMISAFTSYSYIHLFDGSKIIVSTNIQKLQERFLGVKALIRVHRSFIINTSFLQQVNGNQAILTNELECQISRRKRINLKNALN